jgi:hypothetical protein
VTHVPEDAKDTAPEPEPGLEQTTAPLDYLQEEDHTPLDQTRADMRHVLGSELPPRRERK